MKLIKTEEAVGQMLCHDMTQIIPGEFKGPLFRKGHIVTEEDIPLLLSIGKDHIYVWEVNENMLHEDEAADILCQICTGNSSMFDRSSVKEGKIEVIAACDGLLKIDRKRLYAVNSLGEMMIASRHGDTAVKKGDKIAGTRVIPLIIEKEKMAKAQQVSSGAPVFTLKPFVKKRIGLITTGNEVYYGRIEDKFTPVIIAKLKAFGAEVVSHRLSSDDVDMETGFINEIYDEGVDMIICTGGMSVDPDDRTPAAIRAAVDEVITYGAPVLPGAMFMLGYKGEKRIPVCGLPGCVMYAKRTIFDLMLPRLLADDPVTKEEIDRLGEGGLCLNCDICTFPNCGFGK